MTGLRCGLLAGAAGTTALNAVTYLDMSIRGRSTSSAPQDTVTAIADEAGLSIPGRGSERDHRLEGLGALSGIATGTAVGGVAGWLDAHGLRLGRVSGPIVIGAAAMAATDVSMSALGVTDPREWSGADWVADAVPHLAYGWATHRTIVATRADRPQQRRVRLGTAARAIAVGAATGCRSTAGVAALTWSSRRRNRTASSGWTRATTVGAGLLATGELVGDKLPATPSRAEPPGVIPRAVLSAGAGAAIARRRGDSPTLPAALALLAALGGGALGLWWRETGAAEAGVSTTTAALAEDAVTALLATAAVAGT